MELSFVPWHLLSLATFGLSSLFYSSAYLSAARCEFYAAVRAQVKAEGEAQALRDTYLFEKAGAKTLRRAYNDLGRPAEKLPARVYGNRVTRFFGECLGVTLFVNPQDVAREKIQDREYRLRYMRRCEQGLSYPIRLSPLLQYEHKDHEPALFTRKYPVTTLVLLFFLFFLSLFSKKIKGNQYANENNKDDKQDDGKCIHRYPPQYVIYKLKSCELYSNIIYYKRQTNS